VLRIEPCFRPVSTFDLPPLQGAPPGGTFPGLKPWAESSSPFGAKTWLDGRKNTSWNPMLHYVSGLSV
jgi:hypothetical protein